MPDATDDKPDWTPLPDDLSHLDLIGDLLQLHDAGDRQATKTLLEIAADHIQTGHIPDLRLACWLADYLTERAEQIRPRGRPDKTDKRFRTACLVARVISYGEPEHKAVGTIAEIVCRSRRDVERIWEEFGDAATARVAQGRAIDISDIVPEHHRKLLFSECKK